MDLASAFKSEVVRPVLTLVVPGATALMPFYFEAFRRLPAFATYLENHRTVGFFVAALGVMTAGLILESVGALWESKVIDPRLEKRYPKYFADWYNYLRLTMQPEPVGQRYLRTVTLHLKFELAMAPALIVTAVGLNWMNSSLDLFGKVAIVLLTVGILVAVWYLLYESFNSAKVLAKVRFALLTQPDTPIPSL